MLAQMLQALHRKHSNCTLIVTAPADDVDGYLYIKNGNVIAASVGEHAGRDAAALMVAWDDPEIAIYSLPQSIVPNMSPDVSESFLQELALRARAALRPDPAAAPASQSTSVQQEMIEEKEYSMAVLDEAFKQIMTIDGAVAVAMVDWTSGMSLGSISNGVNVDVAAAGNSNVVRAKHQVMRDLGINGHIEDILITLESQYHLIRPLVSNNNLFIYLVLNRAQGNLAMARYRLGQIENGLVI